MAKISKARLRANKKWNKNHKSLQKIYQYHSKCKMYITKIADIPHLLRVIQIARNRINQLSKQATFKNRIKKHCKETHENINILSNYKGYDKPIKMSTTLFGITYTFNYKPSQLKHKKLIFHKGKYIKNFYKKLIQKEKKTKEHIKQLSPYINKNTNIWFKCLDCGKKFQATPNQILGSHSRQYICPNRMTVNHQIKSAREKGQKHTHWTTSKVARIIKKLTNDEYELAKDSKYTNDRNKINIMHKSKNCQFYKKHHKFTIFPMRFSKFLYQHERCPYDKYKRVSHTLLNK